MTALAKRTIEGLDVAHKRVLVRVDFNVPLDKATGAITDDRRIQAALPTIKALIERQARVILVSHLGRPKGVDPKLSLSCVSKRLADCLERPVIQAQDVIGPDAKAKAMALQDGEVLVLENVRFHKEETNNDLDFSRALAQLAEVYVNDAFGTAHRAHASTAGVARFLPSAVGHLIEKELAIMGGALANPARPFVAILGGAKVSDKIGVIDNLLTRVDTLIIGGGMAYTFLAARGWSVGRSLCELDKIDLAKGLMDKAERLGVSLLLPVDTVVATEFSRDAKGKVVASDAIGQDEMGMDIGPQSVMLFQNAIQSAKTIVWNGPMGVFEFPAFAVGTTHVAEAVSASGAVSIIGGGDSAAAIETLGFADRVSHISTGGGASLELLEGKTLPGIDAIDDGDRRPVVAGNWKMNLGAPNETQTFLTALLKQPLNPVPRLIVAPPFTALDAALTGTAYTALSVAAQDGYWVDAGAYTGAVSLRTLAEMGVRYVILGHSERRALFGDDDEAVNKKVKRAIEMGLSPILCVGEALEARERGQTDEVVLGQLESALAGLSAGDLFHLMIAYEPIWAIGTGKTATSDQAEAVCACLRSWLSEHYGEALAARTPILYGGSVKASNAATIFDEPNVDGGLIGGASLDVDAFVAIAKGVSL